MTNKYFKEIQSLRGISVILVFLFHINQNIFSLGYLGVDIFFVISGFVISKILYRDFTNKSFNINSFFVSRFIRLFPALFVMVLVVLFFIILTFTLHDNPYILINTGLTSLLGLSNFYLIFIENDYFNSLDENLFEHMWSLAIEFQFYIFYPIVSVILFKIFKTKSDHYIYFFIITIIIYIFLNLYSGVSFFYHTHLRIGELLIGCLTFHLYREKKKLIYLMLVNLIFFVVYQITQNIFFLLISVCFFTSIIILSTEKLTLINNILQIKILQIIGNASYSIYLWHLPVIYFSKLIFSGIDYYLFSILASTLLSTLSYKFVEKPLRRSEKIKFFLTNKVFTFKSISLFGFIFFLTLFLIDFTNSRNKILSNTNLFFKTISNKINVTNIPYKKINEIEKKYLDTGSECHENYKLNKFKTCYSSKNSTKLIYFFGDSSMRDFYLTYESLNLNSDKIFSSFNNSSFFKPVFTGLNRGDLPTQKLIENIEKLSEKYEEIILILSFMHKFNYNSSGKSKNYFRNQEISYVNFKNSLPKNVGLIFIKDTPYFKYNLRNCEALKKYSKKLVNKNINNNICDIKKENIEKKMNQTNKMFSNLGKKEIIHINLDSYFCENEYCSFYKKINNIYFAKKYDRYHFNINTSEDIREYFNLHIIKILKDW